jgi:hypothetical protein
LSSKPKYHQKRKKERKKEEKKRKERKEGRKKERNITLALGAKRFFSTSCNETKKTTNACAFMVAVLCGVESVICLPWEDRCCFINGRNV